MRSIKNIKRVQKELSFPLKFLGGDCEDFNLDLGKFFFELTSF